jgi:hypothetical protein
LEDLLIGPIVEDSGTPAAFDDGLDFTGPHREKFYEF